VLTERFRVAGWEVRDGFGGIGLADAGERVLFAGQLRTGDDCEAALYAAALGAAVVAVTSLADPVAEGVFTDQFLRLGGSRSERRPPPPLTEPDTVSILDRLASGDSIEVAARTCNMSLRTANRRPRPSARPLQGRNDVGGSDRPGPCERAVRAPSRSKPT
jgi:hypothetical protein